MKLLRAFQNGSFPWILILELLIVDLCNPCFPGNTRIMVRRPKKEPPLVFKEHEPNTHETSAIASGPSEGRIFKTDPRFQNLVLNYNPSIMFKDEEMTGEDRLMSRRCKEKLDNLAMLVANYWGNRVKLRVTEAWDRDGFHAYNSLHGEGRAVDITTSDRDKLKNGMLARLARQAGFDWVYYESRSHVHASVKPDTAMGIRLRGCFPGTVEVITSDGRRKLMADLQIGDQVLTMSANNELQYSPVLFFLDRQPDVVEEYLRFHLFDGNTITLTSFHLIYAAESLSLVQIQNSTLDPCQDFRTSFKPVFAKDVLIGHYLYSSSEATALRPFMHDSPHSISIRQCLAVQVRRIEPIELRGAHAPLTQTGTIVANRILVSCYASFQPEWLAHAAMAPARLYYSSKILISTAFERLNWSQTAKVLHVLKEPSNSTNYGIHPYAKFLLWIVQMLSNNWL